MVLTKAVVHGVYALCFLAHQPEETATPAARIADAVHIPAEEAAKILQALAGAGLVQSVRGRDGGYRLGHPLEDISMAHLCAVLAPRDESYGLEARPCPFSSHEDCHVHAGLIDVHDAVRATLARWTVASIAGPRCPLETDDQHEVAETGASAAI